MVENGLTLEIQYFSVLACSILSILGSAFIITFYLISSQLEVFYTKIVFYIAISDLIRAICFLVPCNQISNVFLLNFVAIINDSCFLITIIWSAYISVTLYQILLNSQENLTKHYKLWMVLTCFIVPLMNCLPIFTRSHGVSGTICTLSSDTSGEIWRILILYLPAWGFIGLSVFACLKIFLIIKTMDLGEEKQVILKKLFVYPIVLIIEIAPLTATMLLINFTGVEGIETFALTAFCIYSLHGFCNAFIFGFTVGLKKIIRDYYNSSYISMQEKAGEKARLESITSENLLYSTFSED